MQLWELTVGGTCGLSYSRFTGLYLEDLDLCYVQLRSLKRSEMIVWTMIKHLFLEFKKKLID